MAPPTTKNCPTKNSILFLGSQILQIIWSDFANFGELQFFWGEGAKQKSIPRAPKINPRYASEILVARGSIIFDSYNLRLIRRHLTDEMADTLVQAFVVTRIDYCNAVLIGTTKQQLNRGFRWFSTLQPISTPANTEVQAHNFISSAIINIKHLCQITLPSRMLSRLQQCCGCWSVKSTRTLHLVSK